LYNSTRIELKGFEGTAEWAAQSAAHSVSPDFPNEFGVPLKGAITKVDIFSRIKIMGARIPKESI